MLILASQSPRRRDLLLRERLTFCVVTRDTEELNEASLPPQLLCAQNAARKAMAVAIDFPNDIVVGADTLVFLDGSPLGKPRDLDDARHMLSQLQGRTHTVCTAVAVFMPDGERRDFSTLSDVTFRPMSRDDIERYISEVDVLDKAGAYAMQEKSELIVDHVSGDVDNVIGLPVTPLLETIFAHSDETKENTPDAGDSSLPPSSCLNHSPDSVGV